MLIFFAKFDLQTTISLSKIEPIHIMKLVNVLSFWSSKKLFFGGGGGGGGVGH